MPNRILKEEDLKTLVLYSVGAKDKKLDFQLQEENIDESSVNGLLQDQFNKLGGTPKLFRRNADLIFELLQEGVDEVLPKRVFDAINIFAEFRTVANGEKVTFKQPTGRIRGRNFITRVAHAGSYEVFQMDRATFDMPVLAYGGAVKIQFEEMLEGRIDFPELVQAVTEGYEEAIYRELLLQLMSLTQQSVLPVANTRKLNGFAPRAFRALLGITKAYGKPTVFCSEVFAAEVMPEGNMVTEAQKQTHSDQGHIGSFGGANFVVLPYSFYDTSNASDALTLPAGLAWILPVGKDKPIKVVFEGETNIRNTETADWGRKIDAYKKMGITLIANPGMTIYHNEALDQWPEVNGPLVKLTETDIVPTYTRLV